MSFVLLSAAALLAALCILNLLLTVGVIRRLREHTELLSSMGGPPPGAVMLGAGERIDTLPVETEDGAVTDLGSPGAEILVGVFSPGCGACTTQMPLFAQRARSQPGGRERVLGVVVGGADEAAPYLEELRPVARVVREGPMGEISRVLKVEGFPAMARIDADGRVLASGAAAEDVEVAAGV